MDAKTLLASTLGGSNDQLSTRDALVCLAYLYSSSTPAPTQIKNAIAAGFDAASTHDLELCLAAVLNP
jgi:hypothetical protein